MMYVFTEFTPQTVIAVIDNDINRLKRLTPKTNKGIEIQREKIGVLMSLRWVFEHCQIGEADGVRL